MRLMPICSSLLLKPAFRGPCQQIITIEYRKPGEGKSEVYSLLTSLAALLRFQGAKNSDERTISLDDFTSEGKIIEWEVPEGKWEVFSFFMCNTGQNLVCPSPNSNGLVIDHLSKRATQRHFDSILARLDPVSTSENHMKFLMLDSYEVWEMKDWSPLFLQEFKDRYGYDPAPFLPLLLGYTYQDSLLAERFRGDYSRLVSDLMIENHFGYSVDIANENGFQMLTERGHGGAPRVDPLKAPGSFSYTHGRILEPATLLGHQGGSQCGSYL